MLVLVLQRSSKRSKGTRELARSLNRPTIGNDTVLNKTFGETHARKCDIVQLAIHTTAGGRVESSVYVVPVISSPINQSIDTNQYSYLMSLHFAKEVLSLG